MKLYTEEQLMKTWNTAFSEALKLDEEDYMPTFYGEFINGLTPIELPSDEEIWEEGKLVFSEKGKTIYTHYNTVPSWSDGAKWMRDKIGGNK
jgi:hypothetical protein